MIGLTAFNMGTTGTETSDAQTASGFGCPRPVNRNSKNTVDGVRGPDE